MQEEKAIISYQELLKVAGKLKEENEVRGDELEQKPRRKQEQIRLVELENQEEKPTLEDKLKEEGLNLHLEKNQKNKEIEERRIKEERLRNLEERLRREARRNRIKKRRSERKRIFLCRRTKKKRRINAKCRKKNT